MPLFEFPVKEKRSHLFAKLGQEHSKGKGFSSSSVSKEFACNAGDVGSIPGSGRSPGEEHGNPRQCSCLENIMDKGAWRATVAKDIKEFSNGTLLFKYQIQPAISIFI